MCSLTSAAHVNSALRLLNSIAHPGECSSLHPVYFFSQGRFSLEALAILELAVSTKLAWNSHRPAFLCLPALAYRPDLGTYPQQAHSPKNASPLQQILPPSFLGSKWGWNSLLCTIGWLELKAVLLPQAFQMPNPKCWDYRHMPSHLTLSLPIKSKSFPNA